MLPRDPVSIVDLLLDGPGDLAWRPLFTIPGSFVLIGGAVLSYWKRKAWYNLLIAVGFVIVALGGVLARYTTPEFLSFTTLLGIAIVFLGFLRSLEVSALKAPEPAKVEA